MFKVFIHYVNVSLLINFSQKTSDFTLSDSNTHPQHMILWRNIANYPFLSF